MHAARRRSWDREKRRRGRVSTQRLGAAVGGGARVPLYLPQCVSCNELTMTHIVPEVRHFGIRVVQVPVRSHELIHQGTLGVHP